MNTKMILHYTFYFKN